MVGQIAQLTAPAAFSLRQTEEFSRSSPSLTGVCPVGSTEVSPGSTESAKAINLLMISERAPALSLAVVILNEFES